MCIFGYHGYHYSTQSWSGWKVWHLSFQTPYRTSLYDNWMHFYILAKFEDFIPFLKKKMIFDASDYNWEMRYLLLKWWSDFWSIEDMVIFFWGGGVKDLFQIHSKGLYKDLNDFMKHSEWLLQSCETRSRHIRNHPTTENYFFRFHFRKVPLENE